MKFSSREKKVEKYLQVEKTWFFNVWNDSWMTHFKSIFLEIYGQDAGCRLVYIFVNLRLSLGRERKRFNQGFYKNVHFKNVPLQNVHSQKRTFTRTYTYKNVDLQKCTFAKRIKLKTLFCLSLRQCHLAKRITLHTLF